MLSPGLKQAEISLTTSKDITYDELRYHLRKDGSGPPHKCIEKKTPYLADKHPKDLEVIKIFCIFAEI